VRQKGLIYKGFQVYMKEFGFNDQIKNLKGNLDCSMKSGYVSKGKD
jgi:hypothetical protein